MFDKTLKSVLMVYFNLAETSCSEDPYISYLMLQSAFQLLSLKLSSLTCAEVDVSIISTSTLFVSFMAKNGS